MPSFAIYSWSQYTLPSGLSKSDILYDTVPNDWVGETFRFEGGDPSTIDVSDDDDQFEDGYVETGSAQVLAEDVTIDGVTYPAGSVVENEFCLVDEDGVELYTIRIDGVNVGFSYKAEHVPSPGDEFTAESGLDGDPDDNDGDDSSTTDYENVAASEYSVAGYASGDIYAVSNSPDVVIQLDYYFDAQSDAYGFTFTEGINGGAPSVDIVNASGSAVISGEPTFRYEVTMTAPDGSTIVLHDVTVGGSTYGWVATSELQPGVAYTVDVVAINASGDAAEAIFGTLGSATYDHDADNVIDGGDNADTIWGDAGADTIDGGAGDDMIDGDLGDDQIQGGSGADTLWGWSGDDHISGDADADVIFGDAGNDTISGGAGDDQLTGGTGDDTFVFTAGGGADTVTDFDIGDSDGDGSSNDQLDVTGLLDLNGHQINANDVIVSADGAGNAVLTFPNGETVTLTGMTPAQITRSQMHAMGIPCLVDGTLIATPDGPRPAETLRPGDLVTTKASGAQPILWRASRHLTTDDFARKPELRPIALAPNWTGCRRRLLLSPQHAVLVRSAAFPAGQLVRAIQLSRMRGGLARRAHGIKSLTYLHFLLPKHEIVFADGLAVETLYPGRRALAALSPAARLSLTAHFAGQSIDDLAKAYGPPGAPYAKSFELPEKLSSLTPCRAPDLANPRAAAGL